jgi:hypothetical protein
VKAADVLPEPEPWLWTPYIPREEVTIVEGNPGSGKSFLMLAVAGALSSGQALPGQRALAPQNTIYLGTEDPPRRLRARLELVHADLDRTVLLPDEGWQWCIDKTHTLKSLIQQVDATLVVIDPVMDFWPDRMDTYRQEEVRPLLSGLAKVAKDTHAAIVLVRHWTKGVETPDQYRGAGSVGFTARARSVIAIKSQIAVEQTVYSSLELIKTNLGVRAQPLYFSVGPGGWRWYEELPKEVIELYKAKTVRKAFGKILQAFRDAHNAPLTRDQIAQAAGWVNVTTTRNRLGEAVKAGVLIKQGDFYTLGPGVQNE